jgi:hypothetical protein
MPNRLAFSDLSRKIGFRASMKKLKPTLALVKNKFFIVGNLQRINY